MLADQAVAVRGDDIVAVGRDATVAARWHGRHAVAGQGRYLIPGLWDMHVHFGGGPALVEENKALMPLYIANGVTTVRDCAGDLAMEVLAWRDQIERGELFGPRLLTSGPKIEGLAPIWKGTLETGSRADVDAAVAKLRSLKVDFVKITDSTLDPQLFLYAVGAARKVGLNVSGHIPAAVTIRDAIDAGISSIEHLDYAMRPGVPNEAGIAAGIAKGTLIRADGDKALDRGFAAATATPTWRLMAARGVAVTPTLSISRIIAHLDQEDHGKNPELAYIGPGLRKTYDWRIERVAKLTPAERTERRARFERTAAILPQLRRAGVTIMAGTDAGFLNSYDYPGFGLHQELALYVRYGLTPAEALASATRAGPAWFGKLGRYGSVAQGRAADLVLLNANPLRSIAATKQIAAVVSRGRFYDRAALDGILADTRAKVATWNATAR